MPNLIHRAHVLESSELTPGMLRLVIGGDGLEGFESTGIGDEYLRLFLPRDGQTEPVLPRPAGEHWAFDEGDQPAPLRTYTVRAWDAPARRLTIDVVMHSGGVAAEWARAARPGDIVGLNSPRGLYSPPADVEWQLLVADATGLPAAARLAEQTPAGVRTRIVLEVADARHEQAVVLPDGTDVHWVYGGNGLAPSRIEEIVRQAKFPAGIGYVWVAGETRVMRGVRRYLRHELALPASAYKVVGYWTAQAEEWERRYEGLPNPTRDRLVSMWADDRAHEEIEDEYDRTLELLGL
jgi:NADPH-dependent ferric siderophore reductase